MTTEAIIELLDVKRTPGEYFIKEDKIFFITPPDGYETSGALGKHQPAAPERWTKWRQSNFEYLKKNLSNSDEGKILIDVGSGQGRFWDVLGRFNYVGVDFYPYPSVNVVADATKTLPFKGNCCDIVVLANVLEHHAEPHFLLKESQRILKPNGFIIGVVPFLVKVHQEPHDFLRYTNFMLEKMFKEAGFREIGVEPLGFPVDLVETAQRRFFAQLYGSSLTRLERGVAVISERIVKGIFALSGRVFQRARPSAKFTEGYGFTARK